MKKKKINAVRGLRMISQSMNANLNIGNCIVKKALFYKNAGIINFVDIIDYDN